MSLGMMAGPVHAAEGTLPTLRVMISATQGSSTSNGSNPCNSLPEYCEPDAVDDYCKAQLKKQGFSSDYCLRTLNTQWF